MRALRVSSRQRRWHMHLPRQADNRAAVARLEEMLHAKWCCGGERFRSHQGAVTIRWSGGTLAAQLSLRSAHSKPPSSIHPSIHPSIHLATSSQQPHITHFTHTRTRTTADRDRRLLLSSARDCIAAHCIAPHPRPGDRLCRLSSPRRAALPSSTSLSASRRRPQPHEA